MTDARSELDRIKARAAEATPGPWGFHEDARYDGEAVYRVGSDATGGDVCAVPRYRGIQRGDAVFIVHSRSDVDRLTEALEAVLGVADTFDRNAEAYECGAEAGSNGITQANCLRSAAHIIRGQIAGRLNKEEQG